LHKVSLTNHFILRIHGHTNIKIGVHAFVLDKVFVKKMCVGGGILICWKIIQCI